MNQPVIFLGMPRYGPQANAAASLAFVMASEKHGNIYRLDRETSLLANGFNQLWCAMLNNRDQGFTHFAMIHADVCPQPGWLDMLLDELDATGADLVSAVVPIKDKRGITSTGLDNPNDPWNVRRLTLREIFDKPATWDEPGLLLNTGLWVCQVGDWCERVHFEIQDRIRKRDDGLFYPEVIPEDWGFTRQLRALGVKVRATRKVELYHERAEFHTRHAWGHWATDEDYFKYHAQAEAA